MMQTEGLAVSEMSRPGAGALPDPPGPSGASGHVGTTSDAAAVIGESGTVLGWTSGAQELLGYPPDTVVGRSAARLLAEGEDPDPARTARIADRCRSGSGWHGTADLRHRDGRLVEVDLRVCAAFALDGQRCFLVSGRERTPGWTVGGSVLDGFLTRSPIGMAVVDPQLRFVWVNDTLERFGGVSREQRLGRRLRDLLPGLRAEPIEAVMRSVLETGTPVLDHEYQGWSWADPYRPHAYSTSFFPLIDANDAITGVCYMVMDVTERWNAQHRLRLINEAGTRIGSTLDVSRTAQELADFAVPRFADFVVVDLLESVLDAEEPPPWPPGTKPAMRRAGLGSVREGCPEAVVRRGERVDFVPPPHDARYLVEGDAVLIPVLNPDDDVWAVEQPARVATIRKFGLHSLISVPMRARDTVLGLATFVRSRNPTSFEPDDLRLAQDLVGRAALCVDNARRFSREHTTALALQRTLLPHVLASGTVLETASLYLPSDAANGVGGDWFDAIPLSGARVGLVVGDVVGHGLTAAATMGRLRTAVHTLADMDLPPDELLAHLDDLVISLLDENPRDEATTTALTGATCLYAVFDPVTQRCVMARAGHPPPVVVPPGGDVYFPDLPAGPPLGLGGLPFETAELELPEGSLIGLYTDGLLRSDGRDAESGMSRLGRALARPGVALDELCESTVRRLLPGSHTDDAALLLVRTHTLSPDRIASWDVPSDPAAVADIRARASRQLSAWGLDELVMTTELIVSELVTNAIRYASGPIRLRLLRQAGLVCEVSDTSNTSPRMRHARTTDEGGRGLFLVAQLTHRWGTRYTGDGKIIWAEQHLPVTAAA
ncbi:SpoIIE family protein phosphatase [Nocardiopsis lucentensis]|uniref:SpoIIE family protein phosphatase n=1 Tax=Nocardiopsis lucentensis TaxID=53441 RepID=UPI00038138BA|nr:SpoIIE family protein phosphatase [Nocardiopsis lucentensis]